MRHAIALVAALVLAVTGSTFAAGKSVGLETQKPAAPKRCVAGR